ncbi:MAG: energy transducer TonB [Gammaproteobacteria bacterium]|nr:energy transducer TonB [Gammaproteobacteria bacterium]NNC97076.1 energy transducer TonB [Gammaproteobacteria bacterium]NNM14063.1 energy transducer TonB [Gammaproteobacteria bacterium]
MSKRILLLFCVVVLTACETPQENMNIEPAVMVKKAKPVYPPKALAEGIEGWAWVRYTVTDKGTVINPVITSSSQPDVFDASALLAIYQFQYTPRHVNGKPTSITGMSYRFEYDLDKYPENYHQE